MDTPTQGTKEWHDGTRHVFRVASTYTELLRDGDTRTFTYRDVPAAKCVYTCECHEGESFYRTLPHLKDGDRYTLDAGA